MPNQMVNLSHLNALQDEKTIQYQLLTYLQSTCQNVTCQSIQGIRQFMDALKEHFDIGSFQSAGKKGLTKAEVLQIVNLRPTSTIELYPIIEECQERFDMDDENCELNLIMELLDKHLPYERPQEAIEMETE